MCEMVRLYGGLINARHYCDIGLLLEWKMESMRAEGKYQ